MASEAERAARDKLDEAMHEWLAVRAAEQGDSGALCLGWIVAAAYTNAELEADEQTAFMFDCPTGQNVAASLGLGTAAGRRWLPRDD